ncbi:hypothetical protein CRUP_015614, partial [Coryphaenoides rupestris]
SASRRPNTPQEDDENMSQLPDPASSPGFHRRHDDDPKHHGQHPAHFPRAHGYAPHHHQLHHHHHHLLHHPHPPTPFPSRAPDVSWGPGLHPSFPSSGGGGGGSWTGSGYPSCQDGSPAASQSVESASYSGDKFPSLAGPYSASLGSLEQPSSLHSSQPSPDLHHHTMSPYYCLPPGPSCCAQCPPEAFKMGPTAAGYLMPMLGPHLPYGPFYPNDSRALGVGGMHNPNNLAKHKDPSDSIQLSLEQSEYGYGARGKVFVTYEADSDEHVNKVINFVALLRHNGFDTHIDMFEQQFRSISKIDFMERYLNEKEYLIIIIISPKYYETVTASPFSLTDERTYNTVYIHKQCHVPSWLQNTHVFSWPHDLDDILRRLMRVEKYNPPRIGQLPTIISMPI